MMHHFSLRPWVSHHSFGDGAIILDTDRDRYWRVDRNTAFGLDWVCGARAGALHPETMARLRDMGLVERSEAPHPSPRPMLPPGLSSAIEQSEREERLRLADFAEVTALLVTARLAVRHRRLRLLTDGVREARAASKRRPADDLDTLARRFHSSRGLVPLAAKCLPDTLAFLKFVGRRGHFPSLVFGVVPVPFAAHCWAQYGDRILNDAVGHTRAFAPILIL